METIAFEQDDKVEVHQEGAIKLICNPYNSHEAGLPEWIKNSSDMYARTNAEASHAVIAVLLKDGKAGAPAMVACLDFGGMTTADIETKFRNWADPHASGSGDVEGGHGNGGKCYMTQLFSSQAYIHTVKGGRGNRYGFKGGSVTPGYFPSKAEGRGYLVADPAVELNEALAPFGLTVTDLPKSAIEAFQASESFTMVNGVGAKHLSKNRIPAAKWVDALTGHQQMIRSIQRNQVFVLHNGKQLAAASPLKLPDIKPIPGAETPRTIPVPVELVDHDSGENVPTGAIEGVSQLVLRTSDVSMRWGPKKARHTINGWTHSQSSTGYWEVPNLAKGTYSDKIYGDIYLDALADYRQNDRRHHSVSPLTRALQAWITEQIEAYASEFVKLDKLQATEEEKTELSRINEQLNNWKNEFLQQQFGGAGINGTGGTGETTVRKPLPKGEVASVRLTLQHPFAGQGVSFRPTVEFFNSAGQRVRAVPHDWISSDWAIATVDAELNTITTHNPGQVEITVVCKDSGVSSNTAKLEVLDIGGIALSPSEIQVHAGSRTPVLATVLAKDGRSLEGVFLIWSEDDSSIAQVGASGMVFGLNLGVTVITAGDSICMAAEPAKVTVVEAKEKDKTGGGFPQILLSEIDIDPLGEVPPAFSPADPPVLQRPQDFDHNIWWINMASPLARRYLDTAKGGGSHSTEWRVYHLERYIEVMVKIMLNIRQQEEDLTIDSMLRQWDEQAVAMQQRAQESLQAFLEGGDVDDTPLKAAA
jgi:virulence-associated protein VagC